METRINVRRYRKLVSGTNEAQRGMHSVYMEQKTINNHSLPIDASYTAYGEMSAKDDRNTFRFRSH